MHTLVVYESMYGNTHAVAEAIGDGLRPSGDVRLAAVGEASADMVGWADLVVVGGPTHAHGMTRPNSRRSAQQRVAMPGGDLHLDPSADGPGIREWLDALPSGKGKRAAAFDTRVTGPALLTGRASVGIAKGLRRRGFTLVADAESFLVDVHTHLVDGERERAAAWGASLTGKLAAAG